MTAYNASPVIIGIQSILRESKPRTIVPKNDRIYIDLNGYISVTVW
ncbi:hypothetical protein [Sphingobacterium bovistauri]|nr:hypothetical protein [Sphingobacterium bovistauri]